MVQGALKKSAGGRPGALRNSSKASKAVRVANKSKQAKLGAPLKLPKNNYRAAALEERELSKAIDKANEQKVAAKLLQGGGKISTTDLLQRGKEMSKDQRRSQVKKKLSRVEEKLKALKQKAESEGLI